MELLGYLLGIIAGYALMASLNDDDDWPSMTGAGRLDAWFKRRTISPPSWQPALV